MTRDSARPRSPKGDAAEGRGVLLSAARELLSEHGDSRFSLAEVAARAGRNIALVSYYFGGKEQMLAAILAEDEEVVLGPLRTLAASDLPAEQQLEQHITGLVDLLAERPYLNTLIHELLRRSGKTIGEDITNRLIKPIIDFQAALLARGLAEGAFRTVDPFVFHLNLMGGIEMLFSARSTVRFGFGLRADDAKVRERFIRETLSLVMDGARARNT
ncbi:TetR family transcriptional regulator [Caulobacter sp. SSI4214]|uniref:TetR family transcriptional regulator n=1 Tax=Caulobacter sp. SSI4214 TaxID=2575739 RepID=UPI001439FF92|nr:TetR family transcriptional regulator [Caulobacter sp. SSI4214]